MLYSNRKKVVRFFSQTGLNRSQSNGLSFTMFYWLDSRTHSENTAWLCWIAQLNWTRLNWLPSVKDWLRLEPNDWQHSLKLSTSWSVQPTRHFTTAAPNESSTPRAKTVQVFLFSKNNESLLTSIAISNALVSHFVRARGVSLSVISSTSPSFRVFLRDLSNSTRQISKLIKR